MKIGILYYTDNALNIRLAKKCRWFIKQSGLPITSVSLKPLDFGKNIRLPLKRGVLTMFRQILTGLEAMTEDIVFFCEHDVIYHLSHFDFIPERPDVFYYNKNVWRIREDGLALYYTHKSTSQLCAWRKPLIKEYQERVRRTEIAGYHNAGYEPGTRTTKRGGYSNSESEYFESKEPNLDIRHPGTMSESRWRQKDFKDQATCQDWKESTLSEIPAWKDLEIWQT